MDKFVVRTPRTGGVLAPSHQPVKQFKQLTLEGLKGVVVLEDLERAKLALCRRDATAQDKLHHLRILSLKTPTTSILQSSGVGAVVAAARKDPDPDVAAEAQRVHRLWKTYNSDRANRPSIEVRCDARTQRLRDSARAMIKEALKSTLKAQQPSSWTEKVDSESLAGRIDERHVTELGHVVSTTSLGYSKGLRVDLDRYHCVMTSLKKEDSDDSELGSGLEDNDGETNNEVPHKAAKKDRESQFVHSSDAYQAKSLGKQSVKAVESKKSEVKEDRSHVSARSQKLDKIMINDACDKVDVDRGKVTDEISCRSDDHEAKDEKKSKRRERVPPSNKEDTTEKDSKRSHQKSRKDDGQSSKVHSTEKNSSKLLKKKEKSKKEDDGEHKTEARHVDSRDKFSEEGHRTSYKDETGEKSKMRQKSEGKSSSSSRLSEEKKHDRSTYCDEQRKSLHAVEDNLNSASRITESKSVLSEEKISQSSSKDKSSNDNVAKSASALELKRKRESDDERGSSKKSKRDFDCSNLVEECGDEPKDNVASILAKNEENLRENSVEKGDSSRRSKYSNAGTDTSKRESQTKTQCNCKDRTTGSHEDSCPRFKSKTIHHRGSSKKCDSNGNGHLNHILQSSKDNKSHTSESKTFAHSAGVSAALDKGSSENVPPSHSEGARTSRHRKKHKCSRDETRQRKHENKKTDRRPDSTSSKTDELPNDEKFETLAEAIERELFSENNRLINKCYKKTIRRIVFTLKHQDRIRKKVITGVYSAGKVINKCWDE